MKTHIIFDYSYLYYKYKYALESGKMTRLSADVEVNGKTENRDVSQIYYSLREIEQVRRKTESSTNEVTISVCFDMPSSRKDEDTEGAEKYKSNRGNKLSQWDFENIGIVQSILTTAGYNCYKSYGYEADDLIHALVDKYSGEFDETIIYTPDADLLVNVKPSVSVMRYKSTKGYTHVDMNNFEEYLSKEMKCTVPYNSIVLFKCTVGDKSDCIDGIKGFGPAAFNKLVNALNKANIDWKRCGNTNAVDQILMYCEKMQVLTDVQIAQARAALNLVANKIVPDEITIRPVSKSTVQSREEAYSKYKMNSLIQ